MGTTDIIDADAIRDLRARLGLTQQELANELKVSIASVQAWEQGNRVPGGPARMKMIRMSQPAALRAQQLSSSLQDTANLFEADALARRLEGDAEGAERADKLASHLYRLAVTHAAAGKVDPARDPLQVQS